MTVMLYRQMTETPLGNGGKATINNLWPCDYIVVEEDEVDAHLDDGWHLSALAAHGRDDEGNPLDAEKPKRQRKAKAEADAEDDQA